MSPFPVRSLLTTAFFGVSLLYSGATAAQLQLEEKQSPNFYMSHISSVALMTAASLAIATDPPVVLGARFRQAPAFERSVQRNFSPQSSTISDVTLLTSIFTPLVTLYGVKEGASYQNSAIIYGQALSATFLLNSMTKNIALRARPFATSSYEVTELDDHLSFYSGHSATSFTAGVSGSYLFSAVETDLTLRSLHWGVALGLSSFTAHARVRAGRHYPTDVLVGAVSGIAAGILTPMLHRVEVRISEEEIASAGAGLFVGTALGSLLPNNIRQQVAAFAPEIAVAETGLAVRATGCF